MSATQELLAEQLRELDVKIAERENAGQDATSLQEERHLLLRQLARATKSLNESQNLLKG